MKTFARKLRNNSTQAEIHLWSDVLRANKTGYPFRRQRPIDQYIADFICLPKKLMAEVDGIIHSYNEVTENDKIRQARLEELGFTVIRFTDDELLDATDNVYELYFRMTEYPPLKRGTLIR